MRTKGWQWAGKTVTTPLSKEESPILEIKMLFPMPACCSLQDLLHEVGNTGTWGRREWAACPQTLQELFPGKGSYRAQGPPFSHHWKQQVSGHDTRWMRDANSHDRVNTDQAREHTMCTYIWLCATCILLQRKGSELPEENTAVMTFTFPLPGWSILILSSF